MLESGCSRNGDRFSLWVTPPNFDVFGFFL